MNTGETIEVHEYPLLYLGDLSRGIGAAGYSAYYIISLLPTQEDIKKIIYHEKKFQLKDEAYWTRDAGLVSGKTGERTTSRDGGYVRCVYKSKGLLK